MRIRGIWFGPCLVLLLGLILLLGGCASPDGREVLSTGDSFNRFMADRPAAAQLLLQHPALEQWMRTEWNRPLGDYHVVWDDRQPKTSPVAENASTDEFHVTAIRVSQKLSAVDQVMALAFETCNAQGRPRFYELAAQAATGQISRREFVEGINAAEYDATLRLKENFPKLLPLSRAELAHDVLYRKMLEAPVGFREFQAWSLRTHNENYLRAQDLYGREYDEIVAQHKKETPAP
jgi:hypothetical protein